MAWIRSQNKDLLIDARLMFPAMINGGYEIKCLMDGMYFSIGEYSTKEKALKVINMIQEQIERYTEYFEGSVVAGTYYKGEYIFNMPQDSEIEI